MNIHQPDSLSAAARAWLNRPVLDRIDALQAALRPRPLPPATGGTVLFFVKGKLVSNPISVPPGSQVKAVFLPTDDAGSPQPAPAAVSWSGSGLDGATVTADTSDPLALTATVSMPPGVTTGTFSVTATSGPLTAAGDVALTPGGGGPPPPGTATKATIDFTLIGPPPA